MLSLLLAGALAATPTTGLVLSNEVGKPGTVPASAHLDVITEELLASRLAVKRLELKCQGERACLVQGAKAAGLPAVVSVSIAWSKKQTTFDLDAIRVSDGASVAQLTFAATGRLGDGERARLRSFAAQLADALPREDAPRVDPVVKNDTPTLTPDAGVAETGPLVVTPVEKPPKTAALVVGGGALLAGAAAGVLLGVASGTNASLVEHPPMYRRDAEALANTANAEYTASLALGVTAGALAVVAVILLVKD
ncbi:MAG: hypothetical protein U0228_08505 [Myxococcaceae bacterium]